MRNSHIQYSNYRCVACNLYFNSFDEQKQHYFTYHSRTVDQGPYTSNIYSYRQLSASNKKVLPVKCDVCNISCSSQTAYDFHVKGKKHSKTLNKIALIKNELPMNNGIISNDINKSLNIPAGVPVIQQSQILYKPNLMCEVCQVNCLKLEQLQKHLDGARHQKKMKLNRFSELKSKKDPSVYCDICDVFMMEESMTKHRKSGKHKRKITDKTIDEPAEKKAKKTDIATSVEHCGFCHVILKNPDEAIAHYQTSKHALNMINRSKNFDLWCDICQISFANQHFFDLHLKGFRHYVRVNRGNSCPEGELSARLLKMREKMKGLKSNPRYKKFRYSDKYKFVPNEPQINQANLDIVTAEEDTKLDSIAPASNPEQVLTSSS